MSGTIGRDELDWIFIALLGILAASFDVSLAVREVGLHRHDKGPVRGIAISGLVKSILLTAMTVIGVVIGILALVTPNPVRPELVRYHDTIVNGLILYQSLLVLVIVVKDWERWYVSRWIWYPVPARHENPESPPLEVAPPTPDSGRMTCDES